MVVVQWEYHWNFQNGGTVVACCLCWNAIFLPVNLSGISTRVPVPDVHSMGVGLTNPLHLICYSSDCIPKAQIHQGPSQHAAKAVIDTSPVIIKPSPPSTSTITQETRLSSMKHYEYQNSEYIFLCIRNSPWTVFILDSCNFSIP